MKMQFPLRRDTKRIFLHIINIIKDIKRLVFSPKDYFENRKPNILDSVKAAKFIWIVNAFIFALVLSLTQENISNLMSLTSLLQLYISSFVLIAGAIVLATYLTIIITIGFVTYCLLVHGTGLIFGFEESYKKTINAIYNMFIILGLGYFLQYIINLIFNISSPIFSKIIFVLSILYAFYVGLIGIMKIQNINITRALLSLYLSFVLLFASIYIGRFYLSSIFA